MCVPFPPFPFPISHPPVRNSVAMIIFAFLSAAAQRPCKHTRCEYIDGQIKVLSNPVLALNEHYACRPSGGRCQCACHWSYKCTVSVSVGVETVTANHCAPGIAPVLRPISRPPSLRTYGSSKATTPAYWDEVLCQFPTQSISSLCYGSYSPRLFGSASLQKWCLSGRYRCSYYNAREKSERGYLTSG